MKMLTKELRASLVEDRDALRKIKNPSVGERRQLQHAERLLDDDDREQQRRAELSKLTPKEIVDRIYDRHGF